ncbi:MAG: Hsp20/alpha crystallin family protein [Desulfobacterales bacterium]|jgi:HSP20 family protein|nr:Hsp20/alpha crystallin family protein [Desulfobacterales bacterium]
MNMMDLIRWNPWKELSLLRNRTHGLFTDPFLARIDGAENHPAALNPAVDVFEKDDKLVIKAELPGMDKNDIQLDVKNDVLTLRGERKHEEEVKEDCFYCKEIASGAFVRSFALPGGVNAEKILAEFKDGILTVEVPKPESHRPKQIRVN